MNLPRLTFPLTVDFSSSGYWIVDEGPFKYGAAVTAFFIGEDIAETPNDGIPLLRELEEQLQTFGSHLKPYVREHEVDTDLALADAHCGDRICEQLLEAMCQEDLETRQ